MAIVAKKKFITEEIVDENGNVLGKICFNPDDTHTYAKLSDILERTLKVSDKTKETKKMKVLKDNNKKFASIDEIESVRDELKKLNEIFHFCDDEINQIRLEIDDIFGKGTCDIMMGESNDIELLIPLLKGVLPMFKEARKKKTQKYLNDNVSVTSEVMN